MSIDSLHNTVQEAANRALWSQGVKLCRDHHVIQDRANAEEIQLRVQIVNKPISPKVTLWPDDEDWFCDCKDRSDPCVHVIASVIALKSGNVQGTQEDNQGAKKYSIRYRFTRTPDGLSFERMILNESGKEEALKQNLISFVGGIQSGRIQGPAVPATQSDFAVEAALRGKKRGVLDRDSLSDVIIQLTECPNVTLDGKTIEIDPKPVQVQAEILDEGTGFRVRRKKDPAIQEVFKNGAVIYFEKLRPIKSPTFSKKEIDVLKGKGSYFEPSNASEFLSEILPGLQEKIEVDSRSKNLPELDRLQPRLILDLKKPSKDTLSVFPILVYGRPPIARVIQGRVELLQEGIAPVRDAAEEKSLMLRLRQELNLLPDQEATFNGLSAIEFIRKLDHTWETSGGGRDAFGIRGEIRPKFDFQDEDFDFYFEFEGDPESGKKPQRAQFSQIYQAWKEGWPYVPLQSGGYAPLPTDWMERYGQRIQDLIEAKEAQGELPKYLVPELKRFCDELQIDTPDSVQSLGKMLDNFTEIPKAELPKDLKANLRDYQQKGVNWLNFLRQNEMGALLADDMGLGKTLQALCVIRGHTLVIVPTSVLQSWASQIEEFRPDLKYVIYHGSKRELQDGFNVVLTSYGLLRRDEKKLAKTKWETIILDEAQTIKNPDSQIARAAHRLTAPFRIALSGTPVENRLDDLWSQFQFINPGLLGSRNTFAEKYSKPILKGDPEITTQLRNRIRPFLLRRLKKEVAPELPERTEVILHCELSKDERDLYESIRAATRKEILDKLEKGGSVFAALEVLLRLRQASCHPSLVPGQSAEDSSKLSLLIETLTTSLELGHKALVFSQWTSFLDLIGAALEKAGVPFLRLDGSTTDRGAIVKAFQNKDGPPVLIMSLKAGGVGLTLTEADHVYIMDPWWNPAAEDQAADRAHRIGQENPVLIQRLVAKDTVEDRIIQLQKKKAQLAKSVLEGTAKAASLTRSDIMALLE